MNIRLAEKKDAREMALIHQREIQTGFLSSLPAKFLAKFYEAAVRSPDGVCVVVDSGNHLVGFIAGTVSLKSFYRFFMTHYIFKASIYLIPRLFNFRSLKKIVENIFYPVKSSSLPKAELLTIAIKKEAQGQGLGGKMLDLFTAEMKKRGIVEFKVVVGAELKQAIKFYEKANFKFKTDICVHDKEPSLVYTYKII